MRKQLIAVLILLGILGVMVASVLLPSIAPDPLIIHGYDGPVARITEIETSTYDMYDDVREIIYSNDARVYPVRPDYEDYFVKTGVRLEIKSAPNVVDTEYLETITEVIVDDVAKTNTTKNWDVQKVKCSMGATAWTYEGGVRGCGEVIFWITLDDNADSIFSTLDDHYAFFVNVYLIDPVMIAGEMQVHPAFTGDFTYTSLSTESVPQWIYDAGYSGNINNHRVIKFPIKILNAEPAAIGDARTDARTEFHIGFDVILFGYWEQTVEYRPWVGPIIPDLLTDIITFLTLMAWIIIGFAATILIFRYVPDMRMKLLAIGIVWVVLLAIYGINAITVWLGGAG
jgi:hypothetical protein